MAVDLMVFHRVDPTSYAALLEYAAPRSLHIAAGVFLPCEFRKPFEMKAPFVDRLTGSCHRALEELRAVLPEPCRAAADVLRRAS